MRKINNFNNPHFIYVAIFILSCGSGIAKRSCKKNSLNSWSNDLASKSCSLLSSDNIASGRIAAGTTGNDYQVPPWVNLTLAHRGQQFARNHFIGVGLSAAYGLMSVLTLPDIKEVLLFTRNSDNPTKVVRRYMATGAQIWVWLTEDFRVDPVNNPFLASLASVRALHSSAAQRAAAHGRPLVKKTEYKKAPIDEDLWGAFSKDLTQSKIPASYRSFSKKYKKYDGRSVPVNQFALALTQFGFIGYFTVNPQALGVHDATDDDLMGLLHIYAIIGYGIGINDEYNICLQPDAATARAYFKDIRNKYYIPSLFKLDRETKFLMEALVAGYNELLPGFGSRALLLRFLQTAIGIKAPHMTTLLTLTENVVQFGLENLIVPRTPSPNELANQRIVVEAGVKKAVVNIFGPYVTNMDFATKVLYNGTMPENSGSRTPKERPGEGGFVNTALKIYKATKQKLQKFQSQSLAKGQSHSRPWWSNQI